MMSTLPQYSEDTAGIYIHIPFCRKACHYCDFHFSTHTQYQSEMVDSITVELKIRSQELSRKTVKTLYFGGGTPSVLTQGQLMVIMETVAAQYQLSDDLEITFEGNPDDLDRKYLTLLQDVGVTRLSIGVQSFDEAELKWMNRNHSAKESRLILDLLENEFSYDYSADLIYGVPISEPALWYRNLETMTKYRVPHLSCYNLTVEPGTALHHMVAKGKSKTTDDQVSSDLFVGTETYLQTQGYQNYEVSNYARDGKYSQHNTGYWFGNAYLGIGPGAHSYDGKSRAWNIANNAKYLDALGKGNLNQKVEHLTPIDRHNEGIMTGLRTQWGVSMDVLTDKSEIYLAEAYCDDGLATIRDNRLILTTKGRLQCDNLSSQLFREDSE